jgi:hypothetical protein
MHLINANEEAFRLTTYNNGTASGSSVPAFKHGLYYSTIENAAINFYRGGSSVGGFLTFTTDNGTERLRITSAGNVGIGTTSPAYKLDISGSARVSLLNSYFTYTEDYGIGTPDSAGLQIFAAGGDVIRFGHRTTGTFTERMRITSSGNVGIGTNNPAQKLDVVGKMKISDDIILAQTNGRIDYDNGVSSGALRFFSTSGNSERMRITSGGNVGIGTTSPSEKLRVSGTFASNALWTTSGGISQWGNYPTAYGGLTWDSGYATVYATGGNSLNLAANGASPDMTIDASGNVGIGTTSPASKLDVVGSGAYDGAIRVRSTSTNTPAAVLGVDAVSSADGYVGTINNWPFQIRTNDVGRIHIDTSGNVGIGTTSPSTKLEVNGGTVGNNIARFTTGGGGGGNRGLTIYSNDSQVKLQVTDNAGSLGSWAFLNLNPDGGNVGIGTTSPNRTLTVNGIVGVNNGTANTPQLVINTDANGAYLTSSYIGSSSYVPMIFETGGSERMRIGTNGYVGVGLSSPTAPIDIKENNYNLWGISGQNVRRALQKYVGYAGDYNQHVILLHPIYDGTTINLNMAAGKIYATRGSTGSGLISDEYEVLTESAYASTTYNLIGKNGSGALYTCYYNGIKYIALIPAYRTSAVAYYFDGYYNNTTGNGLIVVPYRNSNTSVILNTEINNSLTLLTGPVPINFRSPVNIGGAMSITGPTIPSVNNTYTLGGGSNKWSQIWGARFFADDGSVGSPTYTFAGDQDTGFWKPGDGILATSTNGAERMRITSGGNVGIGTTSPKTKLQVGEFGNGNGDVTLFSNSGGIHQGSSLTWNMFTSGGNSNSIISKIQPDVYNPSRAYLNALDFYVGTWNNNADVGTAKMSIVENGNVGIGTTSPYSLLDLNGGIGINNVTAPTDNVSDSQRAGIGWKANNSNIVLSTLITTNNDGAWGGHLSFYTRPSTSGLIPERMRITSSGNVGIGTTSPGYKLHVEGTSWFTAEQAISYTNAIQTMYGGTGYSLFRMYGNSNGVEMQIDAHSHNSGAATIGTYTNSDVFIKTNQTNKMVVKAAGNVGIGTDSPSHKLHVSGNRILVENIIDAGIMFRTASVDRYSVASTGGDFQIYDEVNLSNRLAITSSGDVGIGTTSPTEKLDVSGIINAVSYSAGGTAGFTGIVNIPTTPQLCLNSKVDY